MILLCISFLWHSGTFWFWAYIYSWADYNCLFLLNLKYVWLHILSSWFIHYWCKLNIVKKKKKRVSYYPHAYSLAGGKDHTQSQCLLRQFACICPLSNVSCHLSFRFVFVTDIPLNTLLPQILSVHVMKESGFSRAMKRPKGRKWLTKKLY